MSYRNVIRNSRGRRVLIDFETDNAAFEDYPGERTRLATNAMNRNRDGETEGRLMDTNGNTVGGFREIRG